MNIKKSQLNNFALEAIPVLFHSQTTDFMNYLERDGKQFLEFYWNLVGDRMPEEKRVPPTGLNYEVEEIDEKTRLVIITLPTPKEDGDPYFLGMVARPEKRLNWVRLPTTAVYTLIKTAQVPQTPHTLFGEITPRGLIRERGVGLNPTKSDFKRIVKSRIIKKKKTEKKK